MTDIGADWQAQRTRAERRREGLGWAGSAAAVALAVAGTVAWAVHSDRVGLRNEEAILVNLEAPAPAVEAMSAPAPDVPQTDAPEAPELIEDTPPPPEPIAEDTPLPEPEPVRDLPPPEPDQVTLPDTPPPPPAPPRRPERVERTERPEPKRERAAPPPSQAAAPPSQAQQGQAQRQISAGQERNLVSEWGAQIRSRVERRIRGGNRNGTVTVQITVARGGTLQGLSLARSSGEGALDQRVLQAVQSAAGGFPSAPAQLTKASYTFNIPITVQ